MGEIIDQSITRAVEETMAVFTVDSTLFNPAAFIARLGDITRSHSFLWAETGLQVQEQYSRAAPTAMAWWRGLILATIAADIMSGYTTLRERARWWPPLVQPQDWELQHQRGANRVLDTAVSLGGALIKACQFASTRPDLLPAAYIRTLAPLQDQMPPHPWSTIEAAITRELGRETRAVFAEIVPEPVAAASIAQVHRARLHDGREVAVKVQYPEVANLVTVDLVVLEHVFSAIAHLVPSIQLQPVLDYLKGTLPLELDFAHEAAAMTELRAALRHRGDVVVPEVVAELSTERLLVMDYIDGIKITDREALMKAEIAPGEVARVLNDLYAEQMLRLNILHADPHPGNLFVLPGPRLALLDHGLTIPLKPSLVRALADMVRALVSGDFDSLTAALSEAGLHFDQDVDITTLLQLVGVLLGGERMNDVMDVGTRLSKSFGSIPIEMLMVGRALGLLDGITKQLDPELDTLEIVARYT